MDVARGGQDKTVTCRRFGVWFPPLDRRPGRETPDGPTAAKVALDALPEGDRETPVYVDVIGIGSSAYDTLIGWEVNAVPVNFAEGTKRYDRTGRLKLRNKRTECYWRAREALDPDLGDDLAIAPDNELLADLTAPKYKPTTAGIQVESKEDIIKRLGRSPDDGDAFVLSLLGDDIAWEFI